MPTKMIRQGCSLCGNFLKERIRTRDFYLGLVLLTFALTLLIWLTPSFVGSPLAQSHLKVRPSTFPNLIAYVLFILAAFLIWYSPQTGADASRVEDKRFSWHGILCIALLFAFYAGVRLVGMLPTSMAILLSSTPRSFRP